MVSKKGLKNNPNIKIMSGRLSPRELMKGENPGFEQISEYSSWWEKSRSYKFQSFDSNRHHKYHRSLNVLKNFKAISHEASYEENKTLIQRTNNQQ